MVALVSDWRWSSNELEIVCWAGDVMRVALAIDTHDQETIVWQATTSGINGEMIRYLMLVRVERRFGTCRASHPVWWLAENGAACVTRDTCDLAFALNVVADFTPVCSPQGKGVSGSFVKTLKHNHAKVQSRPSTLTVLGQLPGWVENCNENHPSGL